MIIKIKHMMSYDLWGTVKVLFIAKCHKKARRGACILKKKSVCSCIHVDSVCHSVKFHTNTNFKLHFNQTALKKRNINTFETFFINKHTLAIKDSKLSARPLRVIKATVGRPG